MTFLRPFFTFRAFRFNGLSEWIGRGLSYWWFDHNWGFTVPGPRMPLDTKDPYEGMSGQVWGSQIYCELLDTRLFFYIFYEIVPRTQRL